MSCTAIAATTRTALSRRKRAGTLHCFLRNLDCRLEWCEVFPAKDSLPDVVDRLLALPANRKRVLKARQQWGEQGGFDSSLREACAVAACRSLPGLAALYAGSYPATVQDALIDVVKDCVRFSLPVRADDDDRDGDGVKDDVEYEATTGALLGEHVPQVDVLLRKNSKPQDPGLGPGSALLQAAGIFAIRAAPGSLWPHYAPGLMHLVYLAYNSLREQHHLAGIEECGAASDVPSMSTLVPVPASARWRGGCVTHGRRTQVEAEGDRRRREGRRSV